MRIIVTDPAETPLAEALLKVANTAGRYGDIVRYRDAFALTIWSIDDMLEIKDERAGKMNDDEKASFMKYAEDQLQSDMVERGYDSLNTLFDLYMDEHSPKEIVIGRPINGVTLNGLEMLLGEDGGPKRFPSVKDARDFLENNGFSDEDIEGMTFLDAETEEPLQNRD